MWLQNKRSGLLVAIILLIPVFCQAQHNYNKALADSLGADEYGMKSYVWVILKTGPGNDFTKIARDSIFKGHMANIDRLVKEKKLIVAGPLGKNDQQYRGIFIFDVRKQSDAEILVNTDPVIQSGLMKAEYFTWYGSAALPLYLPLHDQIMKEQF